MMHPTDCGFGWKALDFLMQFAAQNRFTCPPLVAKDHSVIRAHDAVCSPDFFGLNNKGELHCGRFGGAQVATIALRDTN